MNHYLYRHLYHIYSPVCILDSRSHEVAISLLLHPPGDVFNSGLMCLILVNCPNPNPC